MTYEEYLQRIVPPWLQKTWGQRWCKSVGKRMDDVVQLAREAVFVRFPLLAPTDALKHIGIERALPAGPAESASAHAARLQDAWDGWGGDNTPLTGVGGGGGSHLGMLKAIAAAGLPTGATGATIIQHNGRWAQLSGGGALVLGTGPICVNRQALDGTVPGTLIGFTLDHRDQFHSKFAVTFLADVPTLRAGTQDAARLNAAVDRWRPAKANYVGAFVIQTGGGWDWPTNQLWNDGTLWNSDTVHFIPPPF